MITKFDVMDTVFFIQKTWVKETCKCCGHPLTSDKRIRAVKEGRVASIGISSRIAYTIRYNRSFTIIVLEKSLYKTREEAEEQLC